MKIPKLPDIRTREGIKTVARFIVARATSVTIVTIINQNVDDDELSSYKKAGVFVGSHVLGEMVANATEEYVNNQIDSIADMFTDEAEAEVEAEAIENTDETPS